MYFHALLSDLRALLMLLTAVLRLAVLAASEPVAVLALMLLILPGCEIVDV